MPSIKAIGKKLGLIGNVIRQTNMKIGSVWPELLQKEITLLNILEIISILLLVKRF